MATSTQTGDKEESMERDVRHSCSLCMERYRGRCPKILPCFHTFCLPCLIALEASALSAASEEKPARQCDEEDDCVKEEASGKEGTTGEGGDNSGGEGEKPVFLCPTCLAPVPVPEGGVASLQTNFYVEDKDATTEENAPPPAVCAMCKDGEQQPAVYDCQQCQVKMCRTCRHYHDKLMPKHQLTTIPAGIVLPGKGRREKEANQRTCTVHRDQAVCFHCHQCEVSVCLHCKVTSHEGHDTVDLASAALQAKREMSSQLIPSAQKQVQVLESSWQRAERDSRQLARHGREVKQRIESRCNALVAWATAARDQLMEEASAKEVASRSQLTAEKSSTAHLRDSLSSLLSRAVHASSADPDIVMLKNELKEVLLSEEGVDHHTKRAEGSEHPWGWDYEVVDAAVLHCDDVRAYMGRVTEGTGMGMASPPLSLKELTGRVDSWMSEVKASITNVTSQLNSCEHDVSDLQKKEAELEKKMKSTDDEIKATKKTEDDLRKKTEALNTDVQKFSSLDNDITAQKRVLDTLQKTTQSLKDKIETSGKMVSFVATDINKAESKRSGLIVFSKAEVNNGGCYDTTTGHFTVSVPGCYVFTCSIGAEGDKSNEVTAYIVVDGSQYFYIRGSYTSMGCSSISVQLKQGQKVWVEADSSVENYCSSELWFTGALVQPEL